MAYSVFISESSFMLDNKNITFSVSDYVKNKSFEEQGQEAKAG